MYILYLLLILAEMEASERQRHVEVLLNTLTVNQNTRSLQRLYNPHSYQPPLPSSQTLPSTTTTAALNDVPSASNPLYDSVEDAAYKRKVLPEIQDCPAYAFPPPLLPPPCPPWPSPPPPPPSLSFPYEIDD